MPFNIPEEQWVEIQEQIDALDAVLQDAREHMKKMAALLAPHSISIPLFTQLSLDSDILSQMQINLKHRAERTREGQPWRGRA